MAGNEKDKPNETTEANSDDMKRDINKINSLKLEMTNDKLEITCNEPFPIERVQFERLVDKDNIFSKKIDDKLPPIPDGGWGWVVVFAAFVASACADGLAYSFGLLHEEFIIYFEKSQSKTSLIGSLFIAIPLISGPIMSALVDRFGCRTMTIIAGIISTGGFLLASRSTSVDMLCVTLGVISGLAFGILYVTSVVSVAFWFDKRRTLAVSIASCGAGFGTLIYSSLTNILIEMYDWRNTLVLLAGTILNMCVCGALMRNPDWLIIKEKIEKKLAKMRPREPSIAESISSQSNFLNDLLKSGKSSKYILATLMTSLAATEPLDMTAHINAEQVEANTPINAEQSRKNINSYVHVPTFLKQNEKEPAKVIEKLARKQSLYNALVQDYPHVINRRKLHFDQEMPSNKKEPALMKNWYERLYDGFKSASNLRIFGEFHFLMFNLATVILFCWAIIPYFFLKSYMTSGDVGGALMINIIGASNGIGIVALGWAGDQPWMNVTKAYAVCLFICGLSVGAYPLFITNYWALAVISTVFGLSYASSYSYTPAILMELVPIDYFTTGYGFILLGQGLGHLIGPPLGGLLFDLTKSWDLTFYVGSLWLIVAGACVGIIPYTRNVRLCGSGPLLKDAEEAESNNTINV